MPAALAIQGCGLETVSDLLSVARKLESQASPERASRLRELADRVCAEYCLLTLETQAGHPPGTAAMLPITECEK